MMNRPPPNYYPPPMSRVLRWIAESSNAAPPTGDPEFVQRSDGSSASLRHASHSGGHGAQMHHFRLDDSVQGGDPSGVRTRQDV